MFIMLNIPMKILSKLKQLNNSVIRRRLNKKGNVNISSQTKINYSGIKLLSNCKISISSGTIVEGNLIFEKENSSIIIGENTFIGSSEIICSQKITIGNDVLISWGTTIVDHNSHAIRFQLRQNDVSNWYYGVKDWSNVIRKSVIIGDKSWIGTNCLILKGVTIGEGAIVGAGSVITKDIAPWTIVAGNPATIVREIPVNER